MQTTWKALSSSVQYLVSIQKMLTIANVDGDAQPLEILKLFLPFSFFSSEASEKHGSYLYVKVIPYVLCQLNFLVRLTW